MPTQVQKTSNSGTGTALSVTLLGVTAGNFLWVGLVTGGTAAPTSVTDSSGQTPALAVNSSYALFGNGAQYYIENAAAGTHTFTANFAASTSCDIFAAEYSGIATVGALDGTPSQKSSSSGTAITSGNTTPSQVNDLVMVLIGQSGASHTYTGFLGGVTQEALINSGPSATWADLVDTGTAAISSGATSNASSNWSCSIALFKAAGGTQSFSYTMAGGLTFGGSAVETRSVTVVAAGGLTFAGAATQSRVAARVSSGGLSLSGTAAYSTHASTATYTMAGGMTLSGIAAVTTFQAGGTRRGFFLPFLFG